MHRSALGAAHELPRRAVGELELRPKTGAHYRCVAAVGLALMLWRPGVVPPHVHGSFRNLSILAAQPIRLVVVDQRAIDDDRCDAWLVGNGGRRQRAPNRWGRLEFVDGGQCWSNGRHEDWR